MKYFYNQYLGALGYYTCPVLAIRPAIPENYHPAAINIMNKTHFFDNCLQAEIMFLGFPVWINIKKIDLIIEIQ